MKQWYALYVLLCSYAEIVIETTQEFTSRERSSVFMRYVAFPLLFNDSWDTKPCKMKEFVDPESNNM